MIKGGYAGSIKEAKEMNSREVLQALYYESFLSDLNAQYMELNK